MAKGTNGAVTVEEMIESVELPAEETTESTGSIADEARKYFRAQSRTLRAVVTDVLKWDASPVAQEPFTDYYSFVARSNTGNIYRVLNAIDLSSAVMNEEDLRLTDPEVNAVEQRMKLNSEFFSRYGRYPDDVEAEDFRTGSYSEC